MVHTSSGKDVPPASGAQGTQVIHVRNLSTGRDIEVGEGSKPVWSWDGTRLAAYRATPQGTEVVAMTMTDPQLRPVTPPGTNWTIMGWAGDRLLVFGNPLRLYLVSMDGSLQQIPTPDAVIRDPSPTGSGSSPSPTRATACSSPWVDGHLWSSTWGPGSSAPPYWTAYWTANDLVVVAAATGTQIDAPSTVLVLDPANGSILQVPHTQGAVAAFPAPDGASFVLVRGKVAPTWKLWNCRLSGGCIRAGDIRIGVAPVQLR